MPKIDITTRVLEELVRSGELGKFKSLQRVEVNDEGRLVRTAVYEVNGEEIEVTSQVTRGANARITFGSKLIPWAMEKFEDRKT